MKLRILFWSALMIVTLAIAFSSSTPQVFADGSDPMPTCRPSPNHPCHP